MLVSRLLHDPAAHDELIALRARGLAVAVPAPVLREISFGAARATTDRAATARALLRQPIDLGVLRVLDVTADAAWLAGTVEATTAPPPARRGDRRTKGQRRRAFREDILIAATAHVGGFAIRTLNARDFVVIGRAIADAIGGPRLEIA